MKLFIFLLLFSNAAFSAPKEAPKPEMSDALKEATANLALSGGAADAKYNLALVLAKEAKWKEASLFFKQASDSLSGTKKAKALYNLAYTQIMQGDYEKAKDNLRSALSYDLDNKAIKENLAWLEKQEPPKIICLIIKKTF